jgi:hypothetical protein
VFGVGGAPEQLAHARDGVGVRAHVNRRGVAVGIDQPLGGDKADERGAVERGVEGDGIEDPYDREPALAEPHAHARAVDPEPLGGLAAEHDGRVASRRHVEEAPVRHGRADRGGQRWVGGRDGDAAGLGRVDELVAAHGGVRDRLGGGGRLDAVGAPDHRAGRLRQLGLLAEE